MKIKNNVLVSVCDLDIVNGTVTIPNNVTIIDDRAFESCRLLKRIVIPDSVTNIGEWAFVDCNRLKSVTIGKGVTSIGDFAFSDCISLTNVVIPDNVIKIGDWVLSDCINLKSVTIGNGVTRIGYYMFRNCKHLTSITIPNGVTSIGEAAFYGCSNLKNITIGNGVTSIGDGAFGDCRKLKSKFKAFKAFSLTPSGKFKCRDKIYEPGKLHSVRGKLRLCSNGIHYCTNLFETFDYYSGEIDKNIAIFEIEPGKEILASSTSKYCTNSCKLIKRLYREDIIKILNGKE